MIRYDIIPDVKIKDLEIAKHFRYKTGKVLELTLKEFCEIVLEFYNSSNARAISYYEDFMYNYVLEYMIQQGYIEPRLSDPISHAMIPMPKKLVKIKNKYKEDWFPKSKDDFLTVGMLLELYFGENGDDIRKHALLKSKNQSKMVQRFYHYLSYCEEIDSDTLAMIYKKFADCGAMGNNSSSGNNIESD